MNPDELRKNIETIVVVMMENRSFDNVLGHLRHPEYGNWKEVNGIANLADPALVNPNESNVPVAPFFARDALLPSDLPHDSPEVAIQLAASPVRGNVPAMNGFVRAFERRFTSNMEKPPVMGLLTPADLPTTGPLANSFTVCDNWFACLPTSTAPNRLMSMCGYSDIQETVGLLPDQHTVYHWLSERRIPWRVYSGGLPFFALMKSMALPILTGYFRGLDELKTDLAKNDDHDWPQVVFVEPEYHDVPVHCMPPCDNHPPLPIRPGEAFIGRVFSWLRESERWKKMVLVVTYDEHGGFFDHVPPPFVSYKNEKGGFSFGTTGPRVPTIVASPFARSEVRHERMDNTSILQLIAERHSDDGVYSEEVSKRKAQGIVSASVLLDASARNRANPKVYTRMPKADESLPAPEGILTAGFSDAAKDLVAQHPAEAIAKYPQLAAYRKKP